MADAVRGGAPQNVHLMVVLADSEERSYLKQGAVFPDARIHFAEMTSAEEAMVRLSQGANPDAMIIDGTLPGASGLELLAWLHRQPKWAKLPVFLLLREDAPTVQDEAYALGALRVWVKPRHRAAMATMVPDLVQELDALGRNRLGRDVRAAVSRGDT